MRCGHDAVNVDFAHGGFVMGEREADNEAVDLLFPLPLRLHQCVGLGTPPESPERGDL